jgi:hypothetical protein
MSEFSQTANRANRLLCCSITRATRIRLAPRMGARIEVRGKRQPRYESLGTLTLPSPLRTERRRNVVSDASKHRPDISER